MILLTKSLGSPKKLLRSPQEATKNFRTETYNICVAILLKTITPKSRFEINWPLVAVAVAHQQQLKSALSSTSRVESVIELPAGLHGDIPALKAQPARPSRPSWLTGWAGWLYLQFYYYLAVLCDKFRLQSLRNHWEGERPCGLAALCWSKALILFFIFVL